MSEYDPFERALSDALKQDSEQIGVDTARQLAQIRARAVTNSAKRQLTLPTFVPGLSFALAALLVLMVFSGSVTAPSFNDTGLLIEVSEAHEALELYEDLEFYQWLDANGHAG